MLAAAATGVVVAAASRNFEAVVATVSETFAVVKVPSLALIVVEPIL